MCVQFDTDVEKRSQPYFFRFTSVKMGPPYSYTQPCTDGAEDLSL